MDVCANLMAFAGGHIPSRVRASSLRTKTLKTYAVRPASLPSRPQHNILEIVDADVDRPARAGLGDMEPMKPAQP